VVCFSKSDPRVDRVTSVVVDKKRNVFYTLSSSSIISVYRTNGDKAVQRLQTLSNVYKLAQDKALSSPALSAKNSSIVPIQVIDPVESRDHPAAPHGDHDQRGSALFSPQASLEGYGYSNAPGAYKTLGIQHVRLPPTNLLHPDQQTNTMHSQAMDSYSLAQANPPPSTSRPYILSAIENASYFAGLTIATQQGDVDTLDYVFLLSPDLPKIGSFGQPQQPPTQRMTSYQAPSYSGYPGPQGSQRPPLTEQATLLQIPGRAWAICPAPRDPHDEAYATHDPVVTNEPVYQFTEPTREFIVMTNVGLSFLAKRRPIDALKVALEEVIDRYTGSIVHFQDRQVLAPLPY
jgi:nuclear pore complex protein Nup155